LTVSRVFISDLLAGVTALARQAVHSGAISERALARQAGLSQPHLHNVLKGVRALSPASADQLMRALDITVPRMLWRGAQIGVADMREVPLLRNRIGPGSEASFSDFSGYLPFSARLIAPLVDPVGAHLAADLALPPEFRPGDLALLDLNAAERILPAAHCCWVVAENAGLRVRYVRRNQGNLEVSANPNLTGAAAWRAISLHGRDILEIVRARIVWIGREMEAPSAGPSGPAGPDD
jgi:hypothetical protein